MRVDETQCFFVGSTHGAEEIAVLIDPGDGDLRAHGWPRGREVEPSLANAERAHAVSGEPPVGEVASGMANVPGMIALVRAWFAREHGDAERTIFFARQALAHAREDDRYMRFLAS
jgi:hypothetical protein